MLKPDIVRLQHMVDAANEALSFIADKSKSEFKADRALALALEKIPLGGKITGACIDAQVLQIREYRKFQTLLLRLE